MSIFRMLKRVSLSKARLKLFPLFKTAMWIYFILNFLSCYTFDVWQISKQQKFLNFASINLIGSSRMEATKFYASCNQGRDKFFEQFTAENATGRLHCCYMYIELSCHKLKHSDMCWSMLMMNTTIYRSKNSFYVAASIHLILQQHL